MAVPLSGMNVLALSTTAWGSYAGKLLSDYGAQVVAVEPPGGSPLRQRPPIVDGTGVLDQFLSAGTRRVILDLTEADGRDRLIKLASDADVLIDTRQPAELKHGPSHATLQEQHPRLVIVSVTPYGLTGPYADYRASALQLAAVSGWMAQSGDPERAPLMPNSETVQEFFPGVVAAIAAVAGYESALTAGRGDLLEISGQDVLNFSTRYYEATYAATGNEIKRTGDSLGGSPTYRVFKATDGFVVPTASTSTQIELLMTLTETEQGGLGTRDQRYEHAPRLIESFSRWFGARTRDEAFHAAQAWRIPVAKVSRVSEILELDQSVARNAFDLLEVAPGDARRVPAPGVRVGEPGPRTLKPAATIAAEGGFAPRPSGFAPAAHPRLSDPAGGLLAGLRVIDLTNWWAGPIAALVLADLGAEVIKVEAPQKLDPWRGLFARTLADDADGRAAFETSAAFNSVQRNKLDITLNLRHPAGREALEGLVGLSDVLIENYSPRVMTQFGLPYERLAEINPALVMTSLSGFGHCGPWRDYVSFASVAESLAGITDLLGYDGESALIDGSMPSDPMGGLAAAMGTLVALRQRAQTGRGQHVDVSQFEASVPLVSDALLEWSLAGSERTRGTNISAWQAPHGAYPAAGDDRWVAISVASDDEWHALCRAMGDPSWARASELDTVAGRLGARATIDGGLAEWTRARDADELTSELQECGVPCAPVLSPRLLLEDRHLRAREHFQSVPRKLGGGWPQAAPPIRRNGRLMPVRRAAPELGEHNDYVLRELLGYDDARIEALEREGVIGRSPAWLGDERD